MQPHNNFQQGAKIYRNGFLIGAIIGVVTCLIIGKTIWSLPLILGLIGGAIAINTKSK